MQWRIQDFEKGFANYVALISLATPSHVAYLVRLSHFVDKADMSCTNMKTEVGWHFTMHFITRQRMLVKKQERI